MVLFDTSVAIEKEVKAAGLWHIEGKDYVVQDGDELVIRSGV